MENWKRYFKYAALGSFVLLIALLIWGSLIEPRLILDQQSFDVTIPGLSSGWNGAKVGFIADFQIGMWFDNPNMARRSVQQLISNQVDFVLLGGDFVYHPTVHLTNDLQKLVEIVAPLQRSGIPAYAVLGNHDYGMANRQDRKREDVAEQVRQSLEAAGIHVLQNEAVNLKDGLDEDGRVIGDLYLVGFGPHIPRGDLVESALSQVKGGAPKLVMMHNPDTFGNLPPHSATLALAGHTHGGQIRVPFLPQWSYLSLVQAGEVHVDGWIKGYGKQGNQLYVNRGIGFSLLPLRLNCPPEVTIFTLRTGQ